MKKILLLACLIGGVAFTSEAQVYRTAAGIRLDGEQFGLTLQQKLHDRGTIEGIAAMGAREFRATALYEWHTPLLGKRFNYYLGAGPHIGNLKDHGAFTGITGIGGIEYKVNGLPFLLSADVKPAVHFNHEDWMNFSTGISIRYVIIPEKKQKKSLWPFGKKEDTSKNNTNNSNKKDVPQQEEENVFQKIFKKREN